MNEKNVGKALLEKSVTRSISFETFRNIGQYEISNLKKDKPTAFNGNVLIKKHKVTIEEIKEPIEVYHKRIQELWDLCDNFHHLQPIKNVAKELGYELKGQFGNKISNQ